MSLRESIDRPGEATAPSPTPAEPQDGQAASGWHRYRALLLIAGGALILRLLLVFVIHPTCPFDPDHWDRRYQTTPGLQQVDSAASGCLSIEGDSMPMYMEGRLLADGKGFSDPIRYMVVGTLSPTGWKPPMLSVIVAVLAKVGITSPDGVRAVSATMGAGAVGVIGLVAWRLSGRRAGVIAAVIAALYPLMWINDWRLLNESPLGLFTALTFWLSYRFWGRPTPARAAALGIVIGVAGYARFETPLIAFSLIGPLCLGIRYLKWSRRFALAFTAGFSMVAVLMPWWIFNMARFNQPSAITSTGGGWGLKNGSCDSAWYGDYIGYLDFECLDLELRSRHSLQLRNPNLDESDIDLIYRDHAVEYISNNLGRFPAVAAARAGRVWDLYRPIQNTEFNIEIEQRGSVDSWAALFCYYLVLPTGLCGIVLLARRRVTIAPFFGVSVVVTLAATLGFGLTRYRLPADVGLCVGAGVAVDALWARRRARAGGSGGLAGEGPNQPAEDIAAAAARMSRIHRWRVPRAAYGALGAVLIIGIGVVAWSSTLEPNPVPPPSNPELCARLAQLNLQRVGDLVSSDRASPVVIQRASDDLESISALLPADVRESISAIRAFIDKYLAPDSTPTRWADIPKADRDEVTNAALQLGIYQGKSCR